MLLTNETKNNILEILLSLETIENEKGISFISYTEAREKLNVKGVQLTLGEIKKLIMPYKIKAAEAELNEKDHLIKNFINIDHLIEYIQTLKVQPSLEELSQNFNRNRVKEKEVQTNEWDIIDILIQGEEMTFMKRQRKIYLMDEDVLSVLDNSSNPSEIINRILRREFKKRGYLE